MDLDCFIFDFDGTLAHSEPASREAFRHSILLHTGLELDEAHFKDFWRLTPRDVLRRYSEELLDEMLISFEEYYFANHGRLLVSYDGIADVLSCLIERGSRVAVVSLKPRRVGETDLSIIGLGSLIHATVWGDDVENPKPHPDGVLRAISQIQGVARRTIVIGDSPADIIMGRAAGTHTAAALWNGSDASKVVASSPDFILRSPWELLSLMGSVG